MPILNWNGIRHQQPAPHPDLVIASFDFSKDDDQTTYSVMRAGQMIASYTDVEIFARNTVEGHLSLPRSSQRRFYARERRS